MGTLQSYILREVLKIFGLALAALTLLGTLAGSVVNLLAYAGLSLGDLKIIIPLLAMISGTLLMPLAALFAVTMVYGRLAADNEFTACGAAGINVLRLFRPVLMLSVFVVLFTFLFGNFVIPQFITRIEGLLRVNVRDIVANQIRSKGFVQKAAPKGGETWTVTAEDVRLVADDALSQRGYPTGPEMGYLLLERPTFLQVDARGQLHRFTVARQGLACFDRGKSPPEVTAYVIEARDFQIDRGAVLLKEQMIGPIAIPFFRIPVRMSFVDMRTLIDWLQNPWNSPRVAEKLDGFRVELFGQRLFEFAAARLATGPLVLLDASGRRYEITAKKSRHAERQLTLEDVGVEVFRAADPLPLRYTAPRAVLIARPLPSEQLIIELRLTPTDGGKVLEYTAHGGRYDAPREKPVLSLDELQVPAAVAAEISALPRSAMVSPDGALPPLTQDLTDKRVGLQKLVREERREIEMTMHFRLGMVASALVTTILGAALGVIFRGSHILAAFALACMPLLTVWLIAVIGRMVGKEASAPLGMSVIWGGLLLVALADGVILLRGVRR